MAAQKITLEAWAKARFNPPPGVRTLQRWAREGQLHPAPVKLGRSYYIAPTAVHTSEMLAGDGGGQSLVERLEAGR